jgi:alkylation response protein AidB-like acyl-CoA dehydrogenase
MWEALAKADLLGIGLPESAGGGNLGFTALCLFLQEVGRAVAPVPALPTLVLGALPLVQFGTAEQQQRWLPGVVAGTTILTGAQTEFGNPSRDRPLTTARRDGNDFVLDGTKECVPCAHVAARILVPATISEEETGMFLVDPLAGGVSLERQRTTDRQPHARVRLEGVRISETDRIGAGNRAKEVVPAAALHAAAAYCMMQLGVSERALEMTAAYTTERRQFDRPIGSFQAVHTRAADAFIDIEAIRLTAWQAVWALESGAPAEDAVAVASYWAAEGGQRAGYAAQHLHGGIGLDVEYPLFRHYLWAKQIELTLGPASLELERIGDALAR